MAGQAEPTGLLAPLEAPAFRAMWAGNQAVNLGAFMQGVAVAWLMTSLTLNPAVVALVPVAAAAPALLVTLPAGVLADLIGRRKVLAACFWWKGICALLLAAMVLADTIHPWSLLAMLFLFGAGHSARIPAWQATVQDIVPAGMVAPAISLNSIGFNAARSVGPALGGILVSLAGPGWVIACNGLLQAAGLAAVRSLRHPPPRRRPDRGELLAALRQGFVALRHSPRLLRLVFRSITFNALFASVWAFLPLIGRERLGLSAWEFGLMLTAWGGGAILGAALVPGLRRLVSGRTLLTAFSLLAACGVAALALAVSFGTVLLAAVAGGAASVCYNVSLNVSFQQQAPPAVRARLLAVYHLAFQMAVSIGAILGGWLALALGVPGVLLLCAIGLGLTTLGWTLGPPPPPSRPPGGGVTAGNSAG